METVRNKSNRKKKGLTSAQHRDNSSSFQQTAIFLQLALITALGVNYWWTGNVAVLTIACILAGYWVGRFNERNSTTVIKRISELESGIAMEKQKKERIKRDLQTHLNRTLHLLEKAKQEIANLKEELIVKDFAPVIHRKEGFLDLEKTGLLQTSTKRRWCVLRENALLCYKQSKQGKELRTVITFDTVTVQEVPSKMAFKLLVHGGKTYVFYADSEVDLKDWIAKLSNADRLNHTKVVALEFPSYWIPPLDTVQVIDLEASCPEYSDAKQMTENTIVKHVGTFGGSYKTFKVVGVKRVQNPSLWSKYIFRRNLIASETDGNINERLLFHGTRTEVLQNIIEFGFDPRLSREKGMFGAGVYFAENSSKSNQYIPEADTKQLLLCKVALGSVCTLLESNSTLRRPPEKKRGKPFDSVMGESKSHNSSAVLQYREFVIYLLDQAYPEYIVSYQLVR